VSNNTLFGWAVLLGLCAVMFLPIAAVLIGDMLDGMADLWKRD